jgi:hypothetical protein
MWNQLDNDPFGEELYLAGERVPEGLYRQLESGREVRLDHEDFLPASLDGRVACYLHIRHTWGQVAEQATRGHRSGPPEPS